jgi:predicted O-methyltransferase YrrM
MSMSGPPLAGWEKLLPNQQFNSDRFTGEGPIEKHLYETILRVCRLEKPQDAFRIEPSKRHTVEEMASSPVVLGYLDWLIRLAGVERVLEIGAFVGVSAMYFARAVPEHGHVISIETFDEFADIAERNFANNGLSERITLLRGDAKEVLSVPGFATAHGPFDLVFIDGDKGCYDQYLKLTLPMVSPRGIVVVDDAFFHGDVVNDLPVTEKGAGVRRVLEDVQALQGWNRILLPISNGIMLLYKN